jgi:hypothetical protein
MWTALLVALVALLGAPGRPTGEADELDAFFGVAAPPPATLPAPQVRRSAMPPPPPRRKATTVLSPAAKSAGRALQAQGGERFLSGVAVDQGGAFVWHKARDDAASSRRLLQTGVANEELAARSPLRRLLSHSGANHPGSPAWRPSSVYSLSLCFCAAVTGIQPTSFPLEGYTQITVSGVNFEAGNFEAFRCQFGTQLSSHPIVVINATTLTCRAGRTQAGVGSFTIYAPSTQTHVETAPEVTFRSHASLFVSDFEESQVARFDADMGQFVDIFVKPGSGGLKGPTGMAFGLDENFYVASRRTSRFESPLKFH